jgi:hypothetical protein
MRIPSDAQCIVDAMQKSTRVLYAYTDGSSRRFRGEATFAGTPSIGTLKQTIDMLRCVTDANLFIPEQVGLLPLRSDMVTNRNDIWHRLDGEVLVETIGHPVGAPHIDMFIDRFLSADWNEEASPALCEIMSPHDIDLALWR